MRNIFSNIKFPAWFDTRTIATVLITKIVLLIFGIQSFQIITDSAPNETWFSIWNRWDAESYLRIAQYGYDPAGADRFRLVFFPFYPLLVALFAAATKSYLASALLVSGIATIALGLCLRALVRLAYGEKTAQLAVLFLFIFPTSYFLHIPYTESTFLALTVGCFLAARKRLWLAAGILGFFACLTRINGLILCPALLFEIWSEYREKRKINFAWSFLILIPAGFAVYLGVNYYVAGDPFKFMAYQREQWGKHLTFPWRGLKGAFEGIYYKSPNGIQMDSLQELLFALIGLTAIVSGWRYLRGSYRVWMIANWLLFVSTSFVQSVPRYTIILFPIFILMGLAGARNWKVRVFFTVWSLFYLSLFATQFVRGWWAF